MSWTTVTETVIPDHVNPELIGEWPLKHGTRTDRDPFNDLAMQVHRGPDLLYAPQGYPGNIPVWVPRRMADLREIYLDTEHFSSKDFAPYSKITGGTWTNSPAELDPPLHGPFRQMLNPLFTPKAMAELEDKIRAFAVEYIEGFKAKGEIEFISAFAFEFPIKVFCDLMGLPQDRVSEFLQWEMGLLHSATLEEKAEATRKTIAYLTEVLEERRREPRGDLITWATNATKEGKGLTQDEQLGFMFNLFIGGLDTVSANTSNQFWHLATHPEDQEYLRQNPDKIPQAVEEFMRALAAVTTLRTCIKETTIRGQVIKPGEKVLMSTTLAGRDDQEFENPGEIRLDRKPRHVGFGFGIHTCIGMHLAKRELRIAMEEFLRRIPPFRLKEGHRVEFRLGVIQPDKLPLVWTPV